MNAYSSAPRVASLPTSQERAMPQTRTVAKAPQVGSVAVVHPGSLARWLEALSRIQIPALRRVYDAKRRRLDTTQLSDEGGVYCFWWTGAAEQLFGDAATRDLELIGPARSPVPVRFDEEWLGAAAGQPIPLYVGKTSKGVRGRVKQHLLLGKSRILPKLTNTLKHKRPTTTCQLRSGIDQLFPQSDDTEPLVLDNIGLSYVPLPGAVNAANRFYLETLAIGSMRPPLNIDVER